MELQNLFDQVIAFAQECGMEQKTSGNPKGNAIVRDNATGKQNNQEDFLKGAYFGFIRDEEEYSGGYHDYSLVFFPQIDGKACVVAFGVGSLGFANDYDIATLPWVRRLFSKLRKEGCQAYFKNDFSDIENSSLDLMAEIKENYPQLKKVIDTYKKVLPASQILNFSDETKDEENILTIKRWIATYALIRNWANKTQMKTVKKYLPQDNKKTLEPHLIDFILRQDKFVVLQGAPGTGKTYTALKISENFDKVFFEQFHAETSYKEVPEFWDEWKSDMKGLKGMFGVCSDMDGKTFDYWIADLYLPWEDIPEGCETYQIPGGLWALFPCRGSLPDSMQKVNTQIWSEWLPSLQGYTLAGNYSLECYLTNSEDPVTYICIPLNKV